MHKLDLVAENVIKKFPITLWSGMWGGGWGAELDSAIHKLDLVEKNDFSLIWSNLELFEDFRPELT